MRVGVTGPSGLIGRSLVKALEARGDRVVAFVRPNSPNTRLEVVRWNPAEDDIDVGDLRRVGGFDAVVNLAGAGIGDRRWSTASQRTILRSRVDATSLLVRALGDHGGGGAFLASGSAIGWYGSRGEESLDEASPPGTGFLADVCQRWEAAAASHDAGGARTAYLRTGLVMSARGGSLAKQLPLFKVGLGGPLGAGRQWMSTISLLDHVRALLWILDQRITGPVNLVAPQPVRGREFSRALATALHRPALLRVPPLALRAVLGREMADELVLASQRVTPERLRATGFAFEHDSLDAMLQWALRDGA